MPSKSLAQHRLMALAAHGKVSKIPKSVGEEFLKADKGKKFKNKKISKDRSLLG